MLIIVVVPIGGKSNSWWRRGEGGHHCGGSIEEAKRWDYLLFVFSRFYSRRASHFFVDWTSLASSPLSADCEEDLVKAEPALAAAQEALNTLNKNNLTELKSFGSPPGAVTNVTAAVMVLMAQNGKIPKDRSWKQAKMMMAKVDAFLDALINYDKEHIHSDVIKVNWLCRVHSTFPWLPY